MGQGLKSATSCFCLSKLHIPHIQLQQFVVKWFSHDLNEQFQELIKRKERTKLTARSLELTQVNEKWIETHLIEDRRSKQVKNSNPHQYPQLCTELTCLGRYRVIILTHEPPSCAIPGYLLDFGASGLLNLYTCFYINTSLVATNTGFDLSTIGVSFISYHSFIRIA